MSARKTSGPLPTRHVPSLAPKEDRSTSRSSAGTAPHVVGDTAQRYESGASSTSPEGGDWLAERDRKAK